MSRNGWEADERPEPGSLGLLPSGPDPVGEWFVHRQPPAPISAVPRAKASRGLQNEGCKTSAERSPADRQRDAMPMISDPSAGWALDPQLERDTVAVGDLPLCRVLLINDANYPWLLLVPRRPDVVRDHRSRMNRAGATDGRDRAGRARAQGDHRLRQAQHRGARQRGAAASCPCDRALRAATPPGRSRCGARCRRAATTSARSGSSSSCSASSFRWCPDSPDWLDPAPGPLQSPPRTSEVATSDKVPPAAATGRGGVSKTRVLSRLLPSQDPISVRSRVSATPQSLIDRAAERRNDDAWMLAAAGNRDALAYVIGGEMIVLKKNGSAVHDPLFSPDEARALAPVTETVFLGLFEGAARFGIGIEQRQRRGAEGPRRPVRHRSALDRDAGPGRARTICRRSPKPRRCCTGTREHRFCANCGAPTRRRRRRLAARLPGLQGRAFSAHRSGGDHAGGDRRPLPARPLRPVRADHVVVPRRLRRARRNHRGRGAARDAGRGRHPLRPRQLFCSQPWPFPTSLMIGCHAEALTTDIVVDRDELEDARWFSRDEATAMLLRRHPDGLTTPPPVAIAHHIIRAWVESERCRLLARRQRILCAGIAVQDIVFRVKAFPPPGGKAMTDRVHGRPRRLRGQRRDRGGAARRPRAFQRAARRRARRRSATS